MRATRELPIEAMEAGAVALGETAEDFWSVPFMPAYVAVINPCEPERERQSGILSATAIIKRAQALTQAEIKRDSKLSSMARAKKAAVVVADRKAAERRPMLVNALLSRAPDMAIRRLAPMLGVTHRTLRAIAREDGIDVTLRKPRAHIKVIVRKVGFFIARKPEMPAASQPSHYTPRRAEHQIQEVHANAPKQTARVCLGRDCGRHFMSDGPGNRMCTHCRETL